MSLVQLDTLPDCCSTQSYLKNASPNIPPFFDGNHIGSLSTRVLTTTKNFFGSRIAKYTSSSSTVTFQLLKDLSIRRILLSGDIEFNPGPSYNHEDSSFFDSLSSLRRNRNRTVTVGHSNVRGLHFNLSQVKILLLKYSRLDVLAITETHLNESIDDSELYIDGYCLWRLDRRDRKGGGVAFYVKQNIDGEIIPIYEREDTEALWLEVKAHSQRLCLQTPWL